MRNSCEVWRREQNSCCSPNRFFPIFLKLKKKSVELKDRPFKILGSCQEIEWIFLKKDEWIFWFKCVTYLPVREFLICSFSFDPLPNLPCSPIWSHTHKLCMAWGWKCLGILLYNFIKSYNFYILCYNVHISPGMLPSSYLRLKVSNIAIAILH